MAICAWALALSTSWQPRTAPATNVNRVNVRMTILSFRITSCALESADCLTTCTNRAEFGKATQIDSGTCGLSEVSGPCFPQSPRQSSVSTSARIRSPESQPDRSCDIAPVLLSPAGAVTLSPDSSHQPDAQARDKQN